MALLRRGEEGLVGLPLLAIAYQYLLIVGAGFESLEFGIESVTEF